VLDLEPLAVHALGLIELLGELRGLVGQFLRWRR
jgi:hypothetical protein